MPSYKSRISQKHDTETNWNKATNFVPLAGELIVYDTDDTHNVPRVKIGDGNTGLESLPFLGEGNTIFRILNNFPGGSYHSGDPISFSCTLQDNMTSPSIDTMKAGDLCLYENGVKAYLLTCVDPWTESQFDWSAVVLSSTDDGVISGSRISNGSIKKAKLDSAVQTSLDKADNALPISGGTLTGNLEGKYITGTWLQVTNNNHLSSAATKVCVQDRDGWIYHRTPTELLSDLGAASLSASQNWSAEQHFNAGFSALNNNFRFGDTTNIGMELGRQDGTAGTPYIDFHTDGKSSTDYNSRLLATGNQLQVTASGGMSLNNQPIATDSDVNSVSMAPAAYANRIDIDIPTSPLTYTAPTNGYLALQFHVTAQYQYVNAQNRTAGLYNSYAPSFSNNAYSNVYLPARAGDSLWVSFNVIMDRIFFIPAYTT